MVRTLREAKLVSVGLDEDDGVAEALPQQSLPLRMRLDGDHVRAGGYQRPGEYPHAGADIDHPVSRADTSLRDQPRRPGWLQLMPPPL